MGAGTAEKRFRPGGVTPDLRLEDKAMSIKTLAAKNTAATTEAPTDEQDLPAAIEGPYVPREIAGACVIEASAYERTDDGHALRYAGSTPTHVVGVCSPRKARDALAGDGYTTAEIDRAFAWGEHLHATNDDNAWAAVAYAESAETPANAPELVTDGGRDPSSVTGQTHCARCPTLLADVHDRHEATTVTTDGEELCPDCADARCGEEIGFGQCERDECPYCDEDWLAGYSENTYRDKTESTGVEDLR